MLEEDALNAIARRILARPPTERQAIFTMLDAMLRAIETEPTPIRSVNPGPRKSVTVRQSG
jgi:hypothetical protein